jgi:hypothetical protein
MPEVVKDIEVDVATFYAAFGAGVAQPMTIMGLRAHMHQLGTSMRIERVAADTGEVSCLADIPSYDFHWQRSYFLAQPVALDPRDTLRVRCVYDTTSRDALTSWGEGTGDEMCLATFYTIDGAL